jgi:hypothetical membrane protein
MSTIEGNRSRIVLAGSLLVAGGLVFFLFNTVAEGLYRNYSVASDSLSALGYIGTNTSLLWNGQLFVTGLLLFFGMYILFYKSHFRQGVGRIGRTYLVGILFLILPVGAIIVSLFQGNSALGVLHGIASFMSFIFAGISALYAYRLTGVPFRYFSLVLGIVTLVMIPAYILSPHNVPGSISGMLERLIVYPIFLWVITFGSYLMAFKTMSFSRSQHP